MQFFKENQISLNVSQKHFQYTNINERILFHYLQGICTIFKKQFKAMYEPF